MDALDQNIWDRFPTKIINVLEAFHIFDAVMVPVEEGEESEIFGNKEVQIFKNHYYKDNIRKVEGPKNHWDDFKYEMVTLKKKWISFKSQLKNNKNELKSTLTERSLKQIVKKYVEMDEFKEITFLAQVSLTVPVTNPGLNVELVQWNELRVAQKVLWKMIYLMHCYIHW